MSFLAKFNFLFLFFLSTSCIHGQEINVKHFGAKGDGVSLDTEPINKALQELYRNGGGVLFFPKGIYRTNLIDIKPPKVMNIKIRGEGDGSLIKKNSSDKLGIGVFFSEVRGLSISLYNLSIDGNYLNRIRQWKSIDGKTLDVDNECNGILIWNADKVRIEKCKISNVHGSGIAVYSSNNLLAIGNSIANTSGRGILGHRVENMIANRNTISNTGLFTNSFNLGGSEVSFSKKFKTLYGDGIESSAHIFMADGNKIVNPGRIGISHDLARDLGYKNSSATVINNTVEINSTKISNSNPPAGMWFEQTNDVRVINNSIIVKNSLSQVVSGIRFYAITGSVLCKQNTINALNYNLNLNEAIGIYEPRSSDFTIVENVMNGKFNNGISVSYEKEGARLLKLNIDKNYIRGNSAIMKHGVNIGVYSNVDMPSNLSFSENKVNLNMEKQFKAEYFGNSNKKVDKSNFKVINNIQIK